MPSVSSSPSQYSLALAEVGEIRFPTLSVSHAHAGRDVHEAHPQIMDGVGLVVDAITN